MDRDLDTEDFVVEVVEKIREKYSDKEECIDNLNYAISLIKGEIETLEDIPDYQMEEED